MLSAPPALRFADLCHLFRDGFRQFFRIARRTAVRALRYAMQPCACRRRCRKMAGRCAVTRGFGDARHFAAVCAGIETLPEARRATGRLKQKLHRRAEFALACAEADQDTPPTVARIDG